MSLPEAQAQLNAVGVAKSSQYALLFGGVQDILPPRASKRLSISCEECFFPGKNVFTADVRHYGNSMKFPYGREYMNEITMIFRIGGDFFEKRVFEEWIRYIVNDRTNDHQYYDNYTTNIQILQVSDKIEKKKDSDQGVIDGIIDRFKESIDINLGGGNDAAKTFIPIGSEEVKYQCILEKAFPIGIMELPLGHANKDTYERIGVTFTFKKWYSVPVGYQLEQFDAAEQRANEALNTTQKQAVGGKVIDVVTRGSQVYGKVFGRGSGVNILDF